MTFKLPDIVAVVCKWMTSEIVQLRDLVRELGGYRLASKLPPTEKLIYAGYIPRLNMPGGCEPS